MHKGRFPQIYHSVHRQREEVCSVEQVMTFKNGTIILSICSSMHVNMCIKLYAVVDVPIIFSLFSTVVEFLSSTDPAYVFA